MTTVKEWWNENFAQDIHNHLRQQERKRYLYRGHSPQLHLRKRTVKYIHTICEQLEFCTTALHLAIYLMDIFMDNHTIQSKHLQMASLVCLIVAGKSKGKILVYDHTTNDKIPTNFFKNQLVLGLLIKKKCEKMQWFYHFFQLHQQKHTV